MVSKGIIFTTDAVIAVLVLTTAVVYTLNSAGQSIQASSRDSTRSEKLQKLFFESEQLITTTKLAVVEQNTVKHHVIDANKIKNMQNDRVKVMTRTDLLVNKKTLQSTGLVVKRVALCKTSEQEELCVVEIHELPEK